MVLGMRLVVVVHYHHQPHTMGMRLLVVVGVRLLVVVVPYVIYLLFIVTIFRRTAVDTTNTILTHNMSKLSIV